MATFLLASIPVPAHTTNPLPFAARLVERGHRVLWYAGRAFHDRLAAVGAEPLPYARADDFGGEELDEHFPQFAGRSGVRLIARAFDEVFVGQAPARVADLRPVLAAHRVDAMLCDELMYGVGLLSELTGVPWATFGDGPLPFPEPDVPPFGPGLLPVGGPLGRLRNRVVGLAARRVVFRAAQRRYDRVRADLALPPAAGGVLDASTSPYLHLHGAVPSFEYPRRRLPGHVHWVGALRPDPPAAWSPPPWWDEVVGARRPVVAVTQGSIRPDVTELLLPAVRALADEDVLVVVTTGAAAPEDLVGAYGGPLPANVRVAPFVPYDLLLPHAAAFVTNGGYTGVTLALAHGVPLVHAGSTEEKAEIGARVQWSGVGVRLGTTWPSDRAVREGVRRVLRDPAHRAAAARVRDEMARHDAGTEGALLLERLAATRAPVLRGEVPLPVPR
ncbi:glycosyltransferase [Vallicoccus soli]|uniref:Glycosyl transferase n=1 Tax=Vallicoccus soli TaxID=2339232 RepID=A0A3A3ZGD0_9ACTN|nr:nucleotide disphospho-sugar-binding domain-containing protein [Vallicoccus soli]RJK94276.1 glycosyl transferase [Vallicoccus soli]